MSAVIEPVYHVEFIGGREIEKPLPKKLHAFIQRFLILVLHRDLPSSYLALPELNVLTGQLAEQGRREYVVSDITVVQRGAQYLDGDLAQPPVFAVEILSPGQTIAQLFVRSERLLKLGAPVCWVIWPERRRAWMHSADDLREAKESLTAELPDGERAEVRLAAMWAELD
ncbi:MAG: Uma2 family endonuclease [Acidobacteriota bacterium]|nr:Uma2 family endonuclease [Acidobacteriota bacterium]